MQIVLVSFINGSHPSSLFNAEAQDFLSTAPSSNVMLRIAKPAESIVIEVFEANNATTPTDIVTSLPAGQNLDVCGTSIVHLVDDIIIPPALLAAVQDVVVMTGDVTCPAGAGQGGAALATDAALLTNVNISLATPTTNVTIPVSAQVNATVRPCCSAWCLAMLRRLDASPWVLPQRHAGPGWPRNHGDCCQHRQVAI